MVHLQLYHDDLIDKSTNCEPFVYGEGTMVNGTSGRGSIPISYQLESDLDCLD